MSSQEILVALRRIMRAIDLRSKRLEKQIGLTVPQLLILQQLHEMGELSVSEIARGVNLSQGTVTSILQRLEAKGMLTRKKCEDDRRKISIYLSTAGEEKVKAAPELLQEKFVDEFGKLEPWEQKMLTSAVQRIATIMDAETVDASPILELGEIIKPGQPGNPEQG